MFDKDLREYLITDEFGIDLGFGDGNLFADIDESSIDLGIEYAYQLEIVTKALKRDFKQMIEKKKKKN